MYKQIFIIIVIFTGCTSNTSERDIISFHFRPSFYYNSFFEINSNNLETTIVAKIYSEKNPATGMGLDSVYHLRTIRLERKRIEPLLFQLDKIDSKLYKSKSMDWLDGIGINIRYIPKSRKDSLKIYTNSPWKAYNPLESDVFKSFFELELKEDTFTYRYLTKLDNDFFGKYIR